MYRVHGCGGCAWRLWWKWSDCGREDSETMGTARVDYYVCGSWMSDAHLCCCGLGEMMMAS